MISINKIIETLEESKKDATQERMELESASPLASFIIHKTVHSVNKAKGQQFFVTVF
jgi:hypothetical protein